MVNFGSLGRAVGRLEELAWEFSIPFSQFIPHGHLDLERDFPREISFICKSAT